MKKPSQTRFWPIFAKKFALNSISRWMEEAAKLR